MKSIFLLLVLSISSLSFSQDKFNFDFDFDLEGTTQKLQISVYKALDNSNEWMMYSKHRLGDGYVFQLETNSVFRFELRHGSYYKTIYITTKKAATYQYVLDFHRTATVHVYQLDDGAYISTVAKHKLELKDGKLIEI